jgi:archaeosine-15-forming tRNA-guanine transglycosylase
MPGRGPLTRAEIVSCLTDGSLFDENHENYVKGAREHLEGYARNVFSTIDSYVASLPAKPDVIIAGGGGARLLFAMRSKPGYRLSIAAEAELANAMGYWHYATMLAG